MANIEWSIGARINGRDVEPEVLNRLRDILADRIGRPCESDMEALAEALRDRGYELPPGEALRCALTYLYALNAVRYGPKPVLTVDAVIMPQGGEGVYLIKRGREPFKGFYALPGGFVEFGEGPEEAVLREVEEECGLHAKILGLSGVYGSPLRDPRWHTVTVAYLLNALDGEVRAGDDAADVDLVPLTALPEEMAFDHRAILDDAMQVYSSMIID